MSTLLASRKSRGLWLPAGVPVVDWSNPITEGLVGCWVTTGEGGATPFIRDIVTNNLLTQYGSTSKIEMGPRGLETYDAASSGWKATLPGSQKPTQSFSVLWFGRKIRAGSGSATVIGGNYGTGSGTPFLAWGLQQNSSGRFELSWNNGSFNQLAGAASANNTVYSYLGSVTLGANAYLYSNGTLFASGGATSGTIGYLGATDLVSIGANPANASYTGTGHYVGALWNRQLTAAESQLISSDPTAFLSFPTDALFEQLKGTSGGTTWTPSFADTESPTDALTVATAPSKADTESPTDALTVATAPSKADTESPTDVLAVSTAPATIADTESPTDVLAVSTAPATIADTESPTDVLAVSTAPSKADTAATADSNATATAPATITDTEVTTDSAQVGVGNTYTQAAADSLVVVDWLTHNNLLTPNRIWKPIGYLGPTIVASIFASSPTATVALSQPVAAGRVAQASQAVADVLVILDTAAVVNHVGAYAPMLNDAVTALDALTTNATSPTPFSDTTSSSDAPAVSTTPATHADSVTVADSPTITSSTIHTLVVTDFEIPTDSTETAYLFAVVFD